MLRQDVDGFQKALDDLKPVFEVPLGRRLHFVYRRVAEITLLVEVIGLVASEMPIGGQRVDLLLKVAPLDATVEAERLDDGSQSSAA